MSVLVGIDVACKTLAVCVERTNGEQEAFELPNTREGHLDLIRRITRRRARARVALEASGNYHLELALALNEAPRVEVEVVNPRAARDFARARMSRSKTDRADAGMLMEFVRRMPFQPWTPPAPKMFELRAQARRIADHTKTRTQEKNRRHAETHSVRSRVVSKDIEISIRYHDRRIKTLQGQALKLIRSCPELTRQLDRIMSVRGIAEASAIQILGELCVLDPDMTPRQWVAFAGLDPRIFESGLSVHAPARISRMGNRALRAALFMPAMTARRFEPNVKAFYQKLLDRQKAPMQAIVAVMRKLLHAIHGMLRTNTDFHGEKFYALGS